MQQDTKQQIIDAVTEINDMYHNVYEGETLLEYSTDGYVDVVSIGSNVIWSSEDDMDRLIDEENDVYRPYKEHFLLLIKKEYNKIAKAFFWVVTPELDQEIVFNDSVMCAQDKDFKKFWVGKYVGKHPTQKDRHIVLTRARPELNISECVDVYAFVRKTDGTELNHQ